MASTLTDTTLTTYQLIADFISANEWRNFLDYQELTIGGSYDNRLPDSEVGKVKFYKITPASGYYPTLYSPDDSGTYLIFGVSNTGTKSTITTNGTNPSFFNLVYIGKFAGDTRKIIEYINGSFYLIVFCVDS